MEYIFTPSECLGESKKFEGMIVLKVPSTSEKFRIMSKCQFELSEDGVVKKDMKQLAALADLMDATKALFLKVDLKNLATNKEYKSYADLEYAEECTNILIEASSKFLQGFGLGKS